MTMSVKPSIGLRAGPGARRALGAALAAGMSFAVAVALAGAAEALGQSGVGGILALCSLGAAIGVPVGAVLGWVHAPAATASQGLGRVGLVAWLATWAVLLGAALLSVLMALGGVIAAAPDLAGMVTAASWAVALFLIGLLIFGIPAWILAALVSAVWVVLVGAGAGNEPSDGHAGASVGQ